jgi:hypothetical protein
MGADSHDKQLYQTLRRRSCEALWAEAKSNFDPAPPEARLAQVGLIRALGVVFAESGTRAQQAAAREWLVLLLSDPAEKIRRYAMTALPKLGAGPREEAALLALWQATSLDRERKHLRETLEKIGGPATLALLQSTGGVTAQTEQKVRAKLVRTSEPGALDLKAVLPEVHGLRIHLRGRRGLESIMREEAGARLPQPRFTVERQVEKGDGIVTVRPTAPFSLGDLYALRCFGTVGFDLGIATSPEAIAERIVSPQAQRLLTAFTQGTPRYRLEWEGRGHQRGAIRTIVNRAYALCPAILNDPRNALWTVSLRSKPGGVAVELTPRLVPDPRFGYRRGDIPAASHPPLAASMARLAGPMEKEVVWDPFCGSGLELVECALRGGVQTLIGTDRSPGALAIAQANLAAAGPAAAVPDARFAACDFRDFATVAGLGPNRVSLLITNPPMGRRVPIGDLRTLIADLFTVAAQTLRPGGRLVFANPLAMEAPHPALRLEFRQVVDFGGFECRLERYRKIER